MSLRLHTFGSVYLTRNGEALSGAAGQRRLLAILTILASAGDRGMSRDKLLALLWSEGEPDKSRHALTQSLYHIRKALGEEQIFLGGSDLRLNDGVVQSDLADFQRALRESRLTDAVALYQGPFLDGFYLNGDPQFEYWVAAERDKHARQFAGALSTLADAAALAKDSAAELQWRQRMADHDPLDGSIVARLMATYVANGDPASALQAARAHEQRMRLELDLPAHPAVSEALGQLRKGTPATGVASVAPNAGGFEQPTLTQSQQPQGAAAGTPVATHVLPVSPVAPARKPSPLGTLLRSRTIWVGFAASLSTVVVLSSAAASRIADQRALERRATVVVAPFRVEPEDAGASFLREGLLDLLTARMADADRKRPADPAMVLQAARYVRYAPDSAQSATAAMRLAQSLSADEIVTGIIRPLPTGIAVHAWLVDATNGRPKATVDVTGSRDSLIAIADRIISALIMREAGDRLGSMPQPPTKSPLALRAYLAARTAYRAGDYLGAMRSYVQALAEDPGFALAGLGLAMAAEQANAAEQHDRGLAIAWAKQSDLVEADRAFLRAFAGPDYPRPSSASQVLAAWQQAVKLAPDRADAWNDFGESYYYDGELLGIRDGAALAGDAFRHALKIDPSFAPARRNLALLLARQGDVDGLRQFVGAGPIVDATDAQRIFVEWRIAFALRDGSALNNARDELDAAPAGALRSIAMAGQFDGIALDDGDRALEILRHRPLSGAEQIDLTLARHSRALNRGARADALGITRELDGVQAELHVGHRLRVLDALYANADRAAATASALELERFAKTPALATVADSAVRLADACVLGQWRLAGGDVSGARETLTQLRAGGFPAFPVPVGANPIACAELIDASLAITTEPRRDAALGRLAHLDSLMLSGPAVGDAVRYANLLIARHYQKLGEPARGLAALQRRSYMRGWPRYRSSGLELQVELATAIGDTTAARSARERLAIAHR